MPRPGSALNRAAAGLSGLLAVALVSRAVWELMRPLVPTLLVLVALWVVYARLFRRW